MIHVTNRKPHRRNEVIVQAALFNAKMHLSKSVMKTLAGYGAALHRTFVDVVDREGAVA